VDQIEHLPDVNAYRIDNLQILGHRPGQDAAGDVLDGALQTLVMVDKKVDDLGLGTSAPSRLAAASLPLSTLTCVAFAASFAALTSAGSLSSAVFPPTLLVTARALSNFCFRFQVLVYFRFRGLLFRRHPWFGGLGESHGGQRQQAQEKAEWQFSQVDSVVLPWVGDVLSLHGISLRDGRLTPS
jgi:hypothetical protein